MLYNLHLFFYFNLDIKPVMLWLKTQPFGSQGKDCRRVSDLWDAHAHISADWAGPLQHVSTGPQEAGYTPQEPELSSSITSSRELRLEPGLGAESKATGTGEEEWKEEKRERECKGINDRTDGIEWEGKDEHYIWGKEKQYVGDRGEEGMIFTISMGKWSAWCPLRMLLNKIHPPMACLGSTATANKVPSSFEMPTRTS